MVLYAWLLSLGIGFPRCMHIVQITFDSFNCISWNFSTTELAKILTQSTKWSSFKYSNWHLFYRPTYILPNIFYMRKSKVDHHLWRSLSFRPACHLELCKGSLYAMARMHIFLHKSLLQCTWIGIITPNMLCQSANMCMVIETDYLNVCLKNTVWLNFPPL